MSEITISSGDTRLRIKLRSTPTAEAIYSALPIKAKAQTWGEEVYFQIPVNAVLESDAVDVVDAGEIAFWVEGNCIAIGFGRTPISEGNEIRLATPANIWADALDDVKSMQKVVVGDTILVTATSE